MQLAVSNRLTFRNNLCMACCHAKNAPYMLYNSMVTVVEFHSEAGIGFCIQMSKTAIFSFWCQFSSSKINCLFLKFVF